MAIIVSTKEPQKLLEKIKNQKDDNKIRTWNYEGDDFFYIGGQWDDNNLYFKASVLEKESALKFLYQKKDEKIISKKDAYGIIHGRLLEMLLNHVKLDMLEVKYKDFSVIAKDRIQKNK